MEALYLLGSGFLGLLLLYILCFRGKSAPSVPGLQPSDPVSGNLADIRLCGSLPHFQQAQHARFGGVFSFYMGRTQVISMASPLYIRDISHLSTRAYPVFAFLEDWVGLSSIQFAGSAEYWRRRKSYIDPAFGLRGIQQYEKELIALFTEDCFPAWAQQKVLESRQISLQTALRSITLTAFGSELREKRQIEEFLRAYNAIWDYLYAKLEGTESKVSQEEYETAKKHVAQLCEYFVSQRKGKFEPFRFIDLLLKESDPATVTSDLLSFLIGGFHTTGYSVLWLLFFLAKYPMEQEKVAREVQVSGLEVLGSQALWGSGFEALRNFVEETLRLGQVAPTAARVSAETIHLHDGKVIPANTPIIEALALLSASPGLWQNATEFFPDRFNQPIDPYTYRPFGGSGKRICPGKTLSYTWLYIFLGNLLKRYRVELEPGTDTRVEMVYRIVASMKSPPRLIITRR